MGGLTSLPDAPTVARMVIAATGEAPNDLRIVGQGVTALGWRADTDGGSYCVLIALPAGPADDPPQFEARAAVLAALHERDPRCPEPVATNRTPGIPPSLASSTWMVTSWIEGEQLDGPVPDAVARDLGELVAHLHRLPSTGYGTLADTAEEVRGVLDGPAEALTSRWAYDGFWPYSGEPLTTHPIVQAAPHLVMPAAALREQLLGYADVRARAVCHTDLNGSHFLVRDGRLAGLIDFGDAAIVPPAFDIASFAYYAGWEATERFLEGYASNSVLRDIRRAEARQIAVVLTLQKIHKHTRRKSDPARLRNAIAFLEETLPLAARRADA